MKVWLITGGANGLGRYIVEAALAQGHQVLATARRPQLFTDLVLRYGEMIRTVEHDVANESDAVTAVETAVNEFGRLDVVVNNAGFSRFAPFEQMTSHEFSDIVATCFYGVVYTTRAALPVMRRQKSGVIFQVSSVGGRITRPGNSAYHAAKWAVSGFSEAIAQETRSFGVQVCALEPGGIRTNWGKRASADTPDLLTEYQESVGETLRQLEVYWGKENSDPKRMAELIIELSDNKHLPSHLLLGSDALANFARSDEQRRASMAEWHNISTSIDYQ